MQIKRLNLGFLVMMLAVLVVPLMMACGGSTEREFSMRIEDGKITPEGVYVNENEKVTLHLETDEAGEVKLFAYNVIVNVVPGQVVDLNFTAFPKSAWNTEGDDIPLTFKALDDAVDEQIGFVNIKRTRAIGQGR